MSAGDLNYKLANVYEVQVPIYQLALDRAVF